MRSRKSGNGWATSPCCLPEWSDRTAAGKKRPTFLPGGDRRLAGSSSGPASERRSFPASPTSATAAPTSCAAKRCSCSAQLRPAWSTRTRSSAIRDAQQMGAAAPRQRSTISHGHDGRAVQPAEGAQHPRRPAPGRGRGERCVQARRRAARSSTKRFPPTCSGPRPVLLGQAKKEDAASYVERAADRHRCAHWAHRPTARRSR